MLQWIQANSIWLWWMGGISLFLFVGSLLMLPILVARIPADYFKARRLRVETQRITHQKPPHFLLRLGLKILKNVFGVLLLLAGIAMLLLPGQGIVTILLGLMLIDFPGKQNFEEEMIQKPAVLKTINWMREKASKPPLEFLEKPKQEDGI